MRLKNSVDPFALGENKKINNYFLRPKAKGKWLEFDSLNLDGGRSGKEVLGLMLSQKKIKIWLIVLLAGLLILAGRTAYLQFFRGNYFRQIAEGNRLRINDIPAPRGLIYDRHHNLLVRNMPSFSLAIVPVDLPFDQTQRQELARLLAEVSGKPIEEISQTLALPLAYSYQPIVIAENLSQQQLIAAEIVNGRFSGVITLADSFRQYLPSAENPSWSHLLGYQGKIEAAKLKDYLNLGYLLNDYIGKSGLELFYEKELKGQNGKEEVEVDATGEAKEILASQPPQAGKNLVLTVDSELQKLAEESLTRVLRGLGKQRGAVAILDVNSGEVLALVSWPAFDDNAFSVNVKQEVFTELINDSNQPLFNRVISGEYPSGSTFKLIVGAAALEEGLIDVNTGFLSTGGITVSKWFFPDWKAGGHGWTNIIRALSESINTFFYIIGGGLDDFTGLGVDRMKKYAEMFGLNKILGIDLPNEAAGFFPSQAWKEEVKKEQWYIGDTYHLAIGQGDLLVTPLQAAAWTAVFANGGTMYRPYLVKEILDPENNLLKQTKPEILNKDFIAPENIKIINRGLREAVMTGSAKGLGGLPIAVAAKTGTAQWSSKKSPHAWITAFGPYENPQIAVAVLIEEGGEGSSAAMPVARDIFRWWAANR